MSTPAELSAGSATEVSETSSKVEPSFKGAVIFMHGLGDQGASWQDLPFLVAQGGEKHSFLRSSDIKWIFPDAPMAPVSCNNGYVMPSWFDLDEIPVKVSSTDDESGIRESAKRVHEIIKKLELEDGIPPQRVIIGGFSQGALMAFMSSLLLPQAVLGVVMLSGWVPMRNKVAELKEWDNPTPLFAGHGEADTTVEFVLGRESAAVAAAAGYNVEFKSYPGIAHSTSDREMRDLGDWLVNVFSTIE